MRTSGNILINQPAGWWPGGGASPVTAGSSCGGCGSCDECAQVWWAWGGQGQHVGGSHLNLGYGYGAIGPNGPTKGNLPGPVPSRDRRQGWWVSEYGGGSLLPSVTRLTTLLVSTLIRTRWRVFRYTDQEQLPLPQWVYAPMLAGKTFGVLQPLFPAGQRLDSFSWWSTLLTHALWWGRGAFVHLEDSDGQPVAGSMRILNPWLIDVDEQGRWLLDAFGDDPVATDFDGGVTIGNRRWRLRVLRGMPPHDQSWGFGGVLTRHAATFGIGAHIQTYAANVFHEGVPAGILKVSQPNFGPDEAGQLRAAWERAHGGDRRGVAILNSSVDFSPVSLTPVETDLDKAKRLNLMDVAHAFGVSSAWLDTGADSLTYANTNDRRRDLLSHSLEAWGAQLMEMITTVLPAGQACEIVWREYTAAPAEERIPVLVQAVQSGLMTVEEARDALKLPVLPGPQSSSGEVASSG